MWQLPAWGRGGLLVGTVLGAFLVVARPLAAILRRRVDWSLIAADIESHSPQFAERLMTVTSRLLGPAEHRGSDEMLVHLLRDVDHTAATGRRARPVRAAAVLMPWMLVAILLGATAALARVPTLGLPDLLVRFALPAAKVPPVTTTQLAVLPGNVNLPQGRPLRVAARAEQLPRAADVAVAYSTDEGRTWSRAAMLPPTDAGPSDGRFEFTLGSVDRDVRYYVSAGDATSPHYRARVLRPPAVAAFTVRYTYPDPANRPPLTLTNTDGLLEAPAGTEALLTVTATEPLQSAQLRLGGGQRVVMQRVPGEGENVRQTRVKIEKDAPYELDLISTRDVAGGGPPTMRVRAVPDVPPLVRLIQPTGSLRLNPREIVPLTFEALDDYGLASVAISVQPGSGPAVSVPIAIRGDARRQEETHHLDLAAVGLKVGDVVTVTVVAKDRSDKQGSSEPLQILVSPRSVDVDTHVRVAELASASGMAALVADELEAAAAAADEAERERNNKNAAAAAAAMTRGNKHVSSAAETSTLVRQALLRAIVRANKPELSAALAGWVDNMQVLSSQTEELFQQKSMSADGSGGGAAGAAADKERARAREQLTRLVDLGRRTRDELKVVSQGEHAGALLADRENLKATEATPAPKDGTAAERRRQTLRRAGDEIAAGVRRVGLDPGQGDLNDRLSDRRRDAENLVKSKGRVDFQDAARQWSQALQVDASRRPVLDDRLLTAAQAEAVRPFGELVRARDLHLAGRAAAGIATAAAAEKAAGRVVGAGAPNQFVQALAALDREHEYDRKPRKRNQGEDAAIRNAANQARQVLGGYAGDDGVASVGAGGATRPASAAERTAKKRAEELALRASAAAARRDYDEAARLDDALIAHVAQSPKPSPSTAPTAGASATEIVQGPAAPARFVEQKQRIARTMQEARQIDRLGEDQDKLVGQTETASPEAAAALVGEQQRVATEIAGVQVKRQGLVMSIDLNDPASDPNWRSKATAAVVAAQEQLAAMPQRLGEARQASDAWREALRRADEARRMARETKGQARFAADRAAKQMEQDAKEAEDRARRLALPVLPAAAEALAERLGPFAPEAAGARDAVAQQLAAALRAFEQAVTRKDRDDGAADRAAAAARTAIEAAQSQLGMAQEAFTERDPLVAAKWFARAAADSLAQSPPNVKAAQQRQLDTTAALAKAWDRTIHDAAAQRLGVVPSLQPLYAVPTLAGRPGGADPATPTMAAAREWSRLRPRDSDASVAAPLRDADPAGYEDALQKYFESLGKAQGNAKPQ